MSPYRIWTMVTMTLVIPWLVVLCWMDIRSRRLPNALTLGGLAGGLVLAAVRYGADGFVDALTAAGVCVLILILPFLVRAAGGGDLKMLAACGTFVGLRGTLPLFVAMSFSGLLVALVMLVARQASAHRLKHIFRTLFDWRYDRAAGKAALPPREDESGRIPFSLAIAAGTVITLALEAFQVGVES